MRGRVRVVLTGVLSLPLTAGAAGAGAARSPSAARVATRAPVVVTSFQGLKTSDFANCRSWNAAIVP